MYENMHPIESNVTFPKLNGKYEVQLSGFIVFTELIERNTE